MANTELMPEREWHASLPGVIVGAGALITDGAGRVLVVKPTYRDHWSVPGGVCELGEAPQDGCGREVAEEIGLMLPVGRLLAFDWSPPPDFGPLSRPALRFIFDCGVLSSLSGVRLQAEELDDCKFVPESELDSLLPDALRATIHAALAALSSGSLTYVSDARRG